MTGAPNCNNPPWTPREQEIVHEAWSVREAWDAYRLAFPAWIRTFGAVKREWMRAHPKLEAEKC